MKELKSLIGKLGHAAQIVQQGKTFLRLMFELKARMGNTHLFTVFVFHLGSFSMNRSI